LEDVSFGDESKKAFYWAAVLVSSFSYFSSFIPYFLQAKSIFHMHRVLVCRACQCKNFVASRPVCNAIISIDLDFAVLVLSSGDEQAADGILDVPYLA
jgi:hypothetical protein